MSPSCSQAEGKKLLGLGAPLGQGRMQKAMAAPSFSAKRGQMLDVLCAAVQGAAHAVVGVGNPRS